MNKTLYYITYIALCGFATIVWGFETTYSIAGNPQNQHSIYFPIPMDFTALNVFSDPNQEDFTGWLLLTTVLINLSYARLYIYYVQKNNKKAANSLLALAVLQIIFFRAITFTVS